MQLSRHSAYSSCTVAQILCRPLDDTDAFLKTMNHAQDFRETLARRRNILTSLFRLFTSGLHSCNGLFRLLLDGHDQLADLLRSVLRFFGELSHFLRNDSKAAPVLARAEINLCCMFTLHLLGHLHHLAPERASHDNHPNRGRPHNEFAMGV